MKILSLQSTRASRRPVMEYGGWTSILMAGFIVSGCARTNPGTHVELVDKGGEKVYVSGAAAPGMNKSIACRGAVARAAAAIALKFAQEQDDVADDVADAVGVDDGEVFMQRYAKDDAMNAAVQDIKFDPIDHLCMATVRWKPPIFVKDAVLKYAERLKAAELAAADAPAGQGPDHVRAPENSVRSAAPEATVERRPPPAADSVAAPAPATKTVPACAGQRKRASRVLADSQRHIDNFNKCLGKTSGDETICHRYKLYVEDAQNKEADAGEALVKCFNAGLSTKVRLALSREMPGHAGVPVESRADGSLILWTFSPIEQTAFAFEVSPEGAMTQKLALAANQLQWVKEQLGY